MTLEVERSLSAPYKNRRPWLIGFGAAEIAIAGLLFVVSAAQLRPGIFPWHLLVPAPSDKIFAFGFYAGLGAWFLAIAVGSMQCRNWARIAMLVVSGVWLSVGAVSTLYISLLVPTIMRAQHGMSVMRLHRAYDLTEGGLLFLLIVLPVVFLVFYSRQSVRATCLAKEEARGK
jgi:hypothetical protein